jgi:hypothetical protein
MLPVGGVKRTLVMGVLVGDLCPDGVDRKVVADVQLDILAAERARRRDDEDGCATDTIPHGTLILDRYSKDPRLWEPEDGMSPVDSTGEER